MGEERQRLLARVIDELDRNGVRDRSLRELGEAVGTSHRMLIHHFGSRDGLLVAVVEAVEAGERQRTVEQGVGEAIGFADAFRAQWRYFSRSEFAGRERLFFECYARGLTGEEPFVRMHPASITDWVASNSAQLRAAGMPAARARATSRLYVAVIRGLLLDLLATGDRKGIADALEVFLEGHDPFSEPPRGSNGGRAPGRATTSPRRGRPG